MQIFYSRQFRDNICELDQTESAHCIRVLRMKKGSMVNIIDGNGNFYEGIIDEPDPRACKIILTRIENNFEKRSYKLHIALSPLKNQERFEWFVEKSVEIGIDQITPVICRNTEKPAIKKERVNKIIISAMKQSVNAFQPVLNGETSFQDFLGLGFGGIKMIAHCHNDIERNSISAVYKRGQDAVIMIGPEGDFTGEEVLQAVSAGFIPVHLGRSRLRTETAGISACHSIYFINQ
jgi:16S rRNA (uracil1498-N3)-methyltransferase